MYNVEGKIGGDSDLSPRGWEYARALPALIKDNIGMGPLEVWTSTLQRTQQTASYLPFEKKTWKSLDELDAGVCDGMTYEEIEQKYPEDYESRDDDKFNYRYRGGESYRDVVVRLEPVIMELERQNNILIIAHQAILRCLYAYFQARTQQELPYINVGRVSVFPWVHPLTICLRSLCIPSSKSLLKLMAVKKNVIPSLSLQLTLTDPVHPRERTPSLLQSPERTLRPTSLSSEIIMETLNKVSDLA